MKKIWLSTIAGALLALPVCAQEGAFEANVPFQFTIGGETMPAGQYHFELLAGMRAELIGSQGETAFVQATPYKMASEAEAPSLVFRRYGNRYFLSRISDGSASREVPMSSEERELRSGAQPKGRGVSVHAIGSE